MDAGIPPFLSKTYDMVDDPSTDSLVSWANNTFVVWDVPQFSTLLLPKYFKHSNFSSFVRQLNTYGFRKVDPDRWEFANEGFLKGHKHLLKNIIRRKPSHAQQWQQQTSQVVDNTPVPPRGEAGADLGIEGEVDMLKKDKNILMQELVRLRQQQHSTDHQLQTVGQRVHTMEQRQQQMMSFLAKAMNTPSFVSQLVHQQNDGNRQISGGNKKRRLPNEDEDNLAHNYSITSPDGQIVKYQPLMNEAAKAMLGQILVMNNSTRLESKLSDPNGFLIDDGSSSSSRMSGVTLSEVVPNTAPVQSAAMLAHEKAQPTFLPKTKTVPSDFVPEGNTCLPESTNARQSDSIPGFIDAPMSVASDGLVGDDEVDILLDDVQKLPGINDTFWEQFLSNTPLEGDSGELNSAPNLEHANVDMDLKMHQESEWDNLKNMNLTEQLALIASASENG